jgi:uncharacterized membrane protein YfcA
MNKLTKYFLSFLVGLISSLFGAGGGLVAVPLFKRQGLSQKQAQASAIAVILPLCIISSLVYNYLGYFSFSDALGYIPFGIVGTIVGTTIMKKMPDKILKKLFAGFMIYTGINMLMR